MNNYIDMHCHILPGVDDGARNLEETRKMLLMAYEEGIRYIVATPHFHPKCRIASPSELKKKLDIVREEAKKIDRNMRIFIGHEVYFRQDIPDYIMQKKLITLNGSEYVLVEFSPSAESTYIRQGIQQIQMRGKKAVLAHVERYQCIRENLEFAEYLYNSGVLFQVNADSIIGERKHNMKKFVQKLLELEMVFCVGTDAHDSKKRPPKMKKAARYVEKKFGEEYTRRIFFSNAVLMLGKQRQ